MTQRSPTLNRRRAIQITVALGCCGSMARSAAPAVDQITDPGATSATGMFRFEPNLVVAEVGAEVAFLNSRGQHTVHSVPQLWPEGVDPVAISGAPEVRVPFPVDGLYGFRCARHGQYGMVMLVVAGSGGDLSDAAERIEAMRANDREKAAFSELVAQFSDA